MQIYPTLRATIILLSLASPANAATNDLDETASKLLSAEERFNLPKQGAVADPVSGIITHTPGRRLQERRIEKPTTLDYDDKLATKQSSQALILTPQQAAALGPEGIIRIQRLTGPVSEAIRVEKGKLYFKSIGTPQPEGTIKVLLSSGDVTVAGTEFYVEADTNGATRVFMLDGSARLAGQTDTNALPVLLKPGDEGRVAAETAPQVQTIGVITKQLFNNTVQWCLYFPAVLFIEDLSVELRQDRAYQQSFGWYQTGAVQRAWETLPPETEWTTEEKKLYAAALLLALGDVDRSQSLLAQIGIPASQTAQREPGDPTAPRPSPPVGRAERGKDSVTEDRSATLVAPVQADVTLSPSERLQRLAFALRQLMAAVKFDETFTSTLDPQLSTEWLARSYHLQSGVQDPRNIEEALAAARRAVSVIPPAANFAYGWAQVAALEFSRGQVKLAQQAITQALRQAPSNAAPYALQGFLYAAQGRRAEAEAAFQQALELNSKLGDAWLGLGLMAFHNNDPKSGLERLELAVVHEPQRSVLRSYLGKGYYEAATYTANPLDSLKQLFTPGDTNRAALIRRATNELHMARLLDPADPTPDLYSALIKQQQNRINEAVRELERSKKLNNNRAVYRSEFRLDEDQAVRSAGLARLYGRAGLSEVAVREAAQAVASDYLNYSSHLFLAESFDALRDPSRFDLRYETAWANEMLLANLLAPVGAGVLSPNISQQEYTRLFQHDGFSLTSLSEYRSDKRFRQLALQSGTLGRTAWAFDLDYQHNDGSRPNNDLDRIEWYSQLKQQLGDSDTALVLIKYQTFESGDNRQLARPDQADADFRLWEDQAPIVLGGWRHDWSPESQTLFLGGRLSAIQRWQNASVPVWTDLTRSGGRRSTNQFPFDIQYRLDDEIYTAEASHIQKLGSQTLIAGVRAQAGNLDARAELIDPVRVLPGFPESGTLETSSDESLRRFTLYAYDHWSPIDSLTLIAGLTLDSAEGPENFRSPPLNAGDFSKTRLLPKAAAIWTPLPRVTLRGAYAQTLGGFSFEDSVRLEPVQLAGFSQAYRTVIPESLVGSVQTHDLDLGALALDLKFPSRTYAGVEGRWIESSVDQSAGFLVATRPTLTSSESHTTNGPEHLRYRERSVRLNVDQLLSEEFSIGASYRFVDTWLNQNQTSVGVSSEARAHLHEAKLRFLWTHRAGGFAQLQSLWLWQTVDRNETFPPTGLPASSLEDENAHKLDLELGWRFLGVAMGRSRGEVAVGALNLLGREPHLDPLSGYFDLPGKAVFYARLKFDF